MSDANFEREKALAYEEGRAGYVHDTDREANPYTGRNAELAKAWWQGWDTAKAQTWEWRASQDQDTWDISTKSNQP